MDLGCGGGFPGIPLAILFPEVSFTLIDSIGKKIKVVKEVSEALGLTNVQAHHMRAEKVKEQFDFVITRAVAPMSDLGSGRVKNTLWNKDMKLKMESLPLKEAT